LDIVQKIWAPLRKHFVPPGVPRWLRAWDRCFARCRQVHVTSRHLKQSSPSCVWN